MATLYNFMPREIEILQLVLAGRIKKGIAAQMSVAEKTIEFHTAQICTKFGVRTRMLVSVRESNNL